MKFISILVCLLFLLTLSESNATVEFNRNVYPEVIFGSGNTNGSFTTNHANGIEIGLRAKAPNVSQVNSAGDARYLCTLADTDHDNNSATPNRWNFDRAINTDFDESNGSELDEYTYELAMDADPGPGTSYLVFDPVTATDATPFYNHSLGDNNTGNGQGVEAEIEHPYYHFASNSIWFLGHQLELGDDYQSHGVIMLVESWLKEVLKAEKIPYRL